MPTPNDYCNYACWETDYLNHKVKIHFIPDTDQVLVYIDQWCIRQIDKATWDHMLSTKEST